MTEDGSLVAMADPVRTPLGGSVPLGAGLRLGAGSATLGRRIGLTGAGMVLSGLMLGALIMTTLEDPVTGTAVPQPEEPTPASVPSFIPALATLPKLDVGAPGDGALHMTDQPGWHVLRMPR